MRWFMIIAAVMVCGWVGGAHATPVAPNIVANPGFEERDVSGLPVGWAGWNDVWTVDTVAHSGADAARFRNADASRYLLLTQTIPALPGRRYSLSCWIKTENVQGDDTGATACIEWSDKAGSYLGGFYPGGFKGTSDWQHLEAVSTRIPGDAGRVTISVYVRKSMTGTAWFDDVEVKEYPDPPFEGTIRIPGYRGQVVDDPAQGSILVRGWLGSDPHYLSDNREVRIELVRKGAAAPARVLARSAQAGTDLDLTLPVRGLHPGAYIARFVVIAQGVSEPLAALEAPFTLVRRLPPAAVALRPDGITLVRGKPFFPLGIYEETAPGDPESMKRLDEIASGGLNCVLDYALSSAKPEEARKYLDHAQQVGLKVIYSVKDIYEGSAGSVARVGDWKGDEAIFKGMVSNFRSHPAVLAWYLNDELPLSEHTRMARNYGWLRELDPNHPGYVVLYQTDELSGYTDTTDVMGVDPYPIPSRPVTLAADWTDAAVKTGLPAWVVPQIFDWSVYNKNEKPAPPTFDQMRCMIYLAITHGATGLIPYSYFDLKRAPEFERRWGEVRRIVAEINGLAPRLTAGGRGPLRREGPLHVREWRSGGDALLIVVNPEAQAVTQSLALPSGLSHAEPMFGSAAPRVTAGRLDDDFAPLAVHVYHVVKRARK